MQLTTFTRSLLGAAALCAAASGAWAGVSAAEAQKLSTTLTPLGAERAGNKDGTIPAWTGAVTPYANYTPGGRRPDPFAADKPLYSITAKNVDQYADKLTEGTKALFKKFPDTYRIDVYPTRRTGVAPQWVYDNTLKNATRAKLEGYGVKGAFGGVPFPIPQNGTEVMWNHLLRWRGATVRLEFSGYLTNTAGQRVLITQSTTDTQMPYYFQDSSLEEFEKSGAYWTVLVSNQAPALRAGELIVGRENINPDETQAWIYLAGQRRVRKLPNPCCDTPQSTTGGQMTFDEIFGWVGRLDVFDWKLLGKKEMLIPYNANALNAAAKDEDVLSTNHLNPDKVRWELHRVWEVEATLHPGKRHTSPKSRYYIDEDNWHVTLADRWDAEGKLARTIWNMAIAQPDLPASTSNLFGFNDLISGAWFVSGISASRKVQYQQLPKLKDTVFTPDAMAGEGVR